MTNYYIDENFLQHHGVKGMKWGVRKERDVIFTKPLPGGGSFTVTRDPTPPIGRLLAKVSPNGRVARSMNFSIKDSRGKRLGDATILKVDAEELNLMWIGVNKNARGQGIAQACIKGVSEFAKDQGFKRMTLEVPGNSPDAHHIYEKYGFVVTGVESTNDIWGGLTKMERKL